MLKSLLIFAPFAFSLIATSPANSEPHMSINRGVFELSTNERGNSSRIRLPESRPDSVSNRVKLPTIKGELAPNSVGISTNDEYITSEVQRLSGITPQSGVVRLNATVRYREGNHDFAQGVRITDSEDNSQEVFVRGDEVLVDNQDQVLPTSNSVSSEMALFDDGLTLEVLNIREDGGDISDSGLFFDTDDNLIVEDFRDHDFSDGEYLSELTGALTVSESYQVVTVYENEHNHDWKSSNSTSSVLLPHLNSETLEPDSSRRVSVSSEGSAVFSHQSPIFANSDYPTLLNSSLTLSPFAADSEEIVNASVGIRQFLTPTHRVTNREVETGRAILKAPTSLSGQGRAAYENTGLVGFDDGTALVVWTSDDILEDDTYVLQGTEFLPLLIPQQEGSDYLEVGDLINVNYSENGTFTDTGLRVVSPISEPDNFEEVLKEVYGIEDTFRDSRYNSITEVFDGSRTINTVDLNDGYVEIQTALETTEEEMVVPRRSAIYFGVDLGVGIGNRGRTQIQSESMRTITDSANFSIDSEGELTLEDLHREIGQEELISELRQYSTETAWSPIRAEAVLGGVWNYGKADPWTSEANTVRGELYFRDLSSGMRAEVRQTFTNQLSIFGNTSYDFRENSVLLNGGISLTF